jgi:hypothetical protein
MQSRYISAHYIKQNPVNENTFELTLGDSFEGAPHLKIEIEFPDGPNKYGKVKIITQDPKEIEFIRNNLKKSDGQPVFISGQGTEAQVPFGSTLLFCDLSIVKITHIQAERVRHFNPQQLPALMLYDAYKAQRIYLPSMDTDSNSASAVFYRALTQQPISVAQAQPEAPRIDGHTHFVASYPMKDALEKAMASKAGDPPETGKIHIPLLIVVLMLKDRGLLSARQLDELIDTLNKKEMPRLPKEGKRTQPSISEWGNQTDSSTNLIGQLFKQDLDQMSDVEKHKYVHYAEGGAIDEGKLFYCDLHQVQSLLGDKWADFCNGFDMDSTHPSDFTEHMKTIYNYRGWFGKDLAFLKVQLETLYEHNEKQNIGYVEVPGDNFKNSEFLGEVIRSIKEIEEKRASEGKPPIIVRPGLTIARSIDPLSFRKQLFECIPLIIQIPALASITVLAHEVNPTTAHLRAIKDFLKVMNTARPGFTVEVHAGETEFYGEINTNEARNLALQAKRIVLRAGHASYGKHDVLSPTNYIEEKCPLSNASLIDLDPKVHVDVFMGIAEGKTRMFWGSDGVIYNPEYGPKQQEEFLKQIMASPLCVEEIKRRWMENSEHKSTDKDNFEDEFKGYLHVLAKKFNKQLKINQEREIQYIQFKQNEQLLHKLRLIVAYANTSPAPSLSGEDSVSLQIAKNFVGKPYAWNMDTHEKLSTWLSDKKTGKALKACCDALEQNAEFNDVTTNKDKLEKVTQSFLYGATQGMQSGPILLSESKQSDEKAYAPTDKSERGLLILTLNERKQLEELSNLHKLLNYYSDENGAGRLTETQLAALSALQTLLNETPRRGKNDILHSLSLCKENESYKANKKTFEEDLKKITSPLIKKVYEKYRFAGHEVSELIIDPQWLHIKQQEQVKQENKVKLQKGALADATPLAHPDQKPLVLFGEPERCTNDSQQKAYMGKLYQTIYDTLKQGPERQVVLLGGIDDGINPLVYKVLRDHPGLAQAGNLIQIVAADEDSNAVSKSRLPQLFASGTGSVPYRVMLGTKREESHIAYADFITKYEITDIRIFGNGAIWSDLKTVLDSRKLVDSISFYPDGFGSTKTSHAYAEKLPANQKIPVPAVVNEAIVTAAIEKELQSDLYSAKRYKTMPLFNDVLHTWYALGESQIEDLVTFKEYSSLFYPVSGENKIENAKKIAEFFQTYISKCTSWLQLDLLESAFKDYGLMTQVNEGLLPFNLGGAIASAKATMSSERNKFQLSEGLDNKLPTQGGSDSSSLSEP